MIVNEVIDRLLDEIHYSDAGISPEDWRRQTTSFMPHYDKLVAHMADHGYRPGTSWGGAGSRAHHKRNIYGSADHPKQSFVTDHTFHPRDTFKFYHHADGVTHVIHVTHHENEPDEAGYFGKMKWKHTIKSDRFAGPMLGGKASRWQQSLTHSGVGLDALKSRLIRSKASHPPF